MTRPETSLDPISAIPPQRRAPQAESLAESLAGSEAGSVSTMAAPVPGRRWTPARIAMLPLGALCLYAGTMLGLASLDRLASGQAAIVVLDTAAAAIVGAVVAVALVATGVRLVRGVLAR